MIVACEPATATARGSSTELPAIPRRTIEFTLLFLTLPAVAALSAPLLVPPLVVLLIVASVAWLVLRRQTFDCRRLWRPTRADLSRIGFILVRWAVLTVLLAAAVAWFLPERLFHLPRAATASWLQLLLLYPVVSVLPQEVLYRAFFFERYRALFGEGHALVLANAGVFAVLHLVFANAIAVVLTFIGGLLFARTYRESGRLPLVVFEHALYGWSVFSVGLDPFFIGGPLG
jgi:membrane protease YdiL (CAAX protease family)